MGYLQCTGLSEVEKFVKSGEVQEGQYFREYVGWGGKTVYTGERCDLGWNEWVFHIDTAHRTQTNVSRFLV